MFRSFTGRPARRSSSNRAKGPSEKDGAQAAATRHVQPSRVSFRYSDMLHFRGAGRGPAVEAHSPRTEEELPSQDGGRLREPSPRAGPEAERENQGGAPDDDFDEALDRVDQA